MQLHSLQTISNNDRMLSEKKSIKKIIRKFLFGFVNKNFLIFLFFLLLSSAFWLSMTLDQTYEKEISVPIKLTNIPKNIIVTTPLPDTVVMTIRDKGFAFIGYMHSNKFKTIYIDFNTYANNDTGRGIVPLSDVQNILYRRLFNSSKIIGLKSDQLSFFFNFGLSKVLPIILNGRVTPAQNYYLSHIKFWPEKVKVYAQQDILDRLKAISTVRLHITNFSDTIIRDVKLEKMLGVKVVPSHIKIGLYPDILTEESIEVPILSVNMPQGKTLRTFPSKVKVLFKVGANAYRKINDKQFKVEVDYNDLQEGTTDKCPLHLRMAPLYVQQAHLEMDTVDYLIEQQ